MHGSVARGKPGNSPIPPGRGPAPGSRLRWFLVLVGSCVALVPRAATSMDDFEDDVEEKPAAVADPNAFMLDEAQFNAWIFSAYQAGGTRYREQIQSMLDARVAELRRVCDLTESQLATLELAGRGDIARFFDQVEAKRRKFQGKSYPQNQVGLIFQEISPLQEKFSQGLFEDHSLFAKLAARLLDAPCRKRLAEHERVRRADRYANDVDRTILRMGPILGLTGAQRKKLRELVLQETRVPRRIGQGGYSVQIVLAQMSQIPTEKLQPIFDELQWPLAQQYLREGKGMLLFLKNNGYLGDEETNATPEAKGEAAESDANE